MVIPPQDTTADLVPFEVAERRQLTVFGRNVEAVLLPGRKARRDRPVGARPPFVAARAAGIVAAEAYWRSDGLALTPNRFPIAQQQRILWPDEPVREPTVAMWQAACGWTAAGGGTALANTIGAAATIARAHVHLTPERSMFLPALPLGARQTDIIELTADIELLAVDVPFTLLTLRGGDVTARGAAIAQLAESRMTPSWNVVIQGEQVWLYPRRVETPAPWFPAAVGGAELWGRWCYVEEEPFHAATGEGLERALIEAGL